MSEWSPPVECPKCGSTDTRFVEPHYEMSIYECNVCGCRFEIPACRQAGRKSNK